MGFNYESQGNATFLTYIMEENEKLDSMSVGMITNNNIRGIMKAVYTQVDTKRYIKYNISAKITVKQLLSGVINKKRLLGVMNGIADAFISAEEYMIDPRTILLDTQYMFSDVATGETFMICLPVSEPATRPGGAAGFIKEIMFSSRFEQTEDNDYVAKIISYLNNSATAFSPEQFKKVLNEAAMKDRSRRVVHEETPRVSAVSPAPGFTPAQMPGQPPVRPAVQPTVQPRIQPQVQPSAPLARKASPAQRRPEPLATPGKESEYGFSVPGMARQNGENREAPGQAEGKEISLFYLLQHYNKENADAYKAKKERRKAEKGVQKAEKPGKKTEKKAGKKAKDSEYNHISYAVPDGGVEPAPAAPQYVPQESFTGYKPQVPAEDPVRYSKPVQTVDFGDTVYIGAGAGDDTETQIIGMEGRARQIMPMLIRKRNNERIPLDRENFRIGRDTGFNDYPIVDNNHVGHSHCHIISRDGEYFVVDDNSKNHTFVNGGVIPSGSEVKLAHGYVLGVADEEFEFRLY